MEKDKIIVIIIILAVFLLYSLKNSTISEAFDNNVIANIIEKSATPIAVNNYIDAKQDEISANTPCSSLNEYGQCAEDDDQCRFGGRDTITSQTLAKCHGNLHQTENLACTTRLLYKDDYENIKTSLGEQNKELNFIATDVNTKGLENEDHIVAFHDYENKMKDLLSFEISKKVQKENFVDMNSNNNSSGDNFKMLYPSSTVDFIGTYDIQQGQFKLLWNCSIKLQNERMTLYNTHGDIIRAYKVSMDDVKYLRFPTKTIQLTLVEIPLESYKQHLTISKTNRTIREQLIDAQRQLLNDIIGLRDGKFYLFGNDGTYILYDYTKNAILYLDRTN
jgi:hypothetical protein